MGNLFIASCAAVSLGLVAGWTTAVPAHAASRAPADPGYAVDAITVATPGRQATPPTATCVVWANAEGLGVGPALLDGFHGIAMTINPRPLPNEAAGSATSFETGFADLQGRYPKAPPWLLATIRNQRAAIEAACGEDQETPFKVHSIGPQDRQP